MVFNHLRWSETGRGSLWISMITGITMAPPIKVLVQLLENYFILRNCLFLLLCGMNSQRCDPMQINTRINSRKSSRREWLRINVSNG